MDPLDGVGQIDFVPMFKHYLQIFVDMEICCRREEPVCPSVH